MEISTIKNDINRRFCEVVQYLINAGRVASLRGLVFEAGLSYQRYTEFDRAYRQGRQPSRYKTVQVEMMHHLAIGYGVNINWLVTGRGSMVL